MFMAEKQWRRFFPFRNEPGQKSSPGRQRGGTWWVLHARVLQCTQLWRVNGVWGSLSSLILVGVSARREKVLFFAKAKADLFFPVPK